MPKEITLANIRPFGSESVLREQFQLRRFAKNKIHANAQ
jgi:hypothetical protein